VLAIDCETTGMCFDTDASDSRVFNNETGEKHQALSWGLVVAELETYEQVEGAELYFELKWNHATRRQRRDNPNFGVFAEGIHGLTYAHLEEYGISEINGATQIAELIARFWQPDEDIRTVGQNVHLFDVRFLLDMLEQGGRRISFGSRHLDTFSLAMGTTRAPNTDAMLVAVGLGERTGHHNALEDAKLTLEVFRRISTMWAEQGGVVVGS